MTKAEAKIFIDSLEISREVDLKIGLSTRSVCKIKENLFEIQDFISGWSTAILDKTELTNILIGKKSLLDLNWK